MESEAAAGSREDHGPLAVNARRAVLHGSTYGRTTKRYSALQQDDLYKTNRAADPAGETDDVATDAAGTDLLPIYLREMATTSLLEREDEVRLATELQQARKAFSARVAKLPAACRSHVLEGLNGSRKARRLWAMEEIERCDDKLQAYAKAHPEVRKGAAYREVRRAKREFDKSRDGLILANLRLVAHIAKKYTNQGLPFMDLIQEGNIGLMKAVEKFEYERGYKFSTYAYWWIKQAITRALADKARTIRVPVHVGEKIKKIKRATAELGESLGRPPTFREIAKKAGMPVKNVEELMGSATPTE
jgi:DNA-directed RNA polymerase sigma subunit (sigma70/sigma32)